MTVLFKLIMLDTCQSMDGSNIKGQFELQIYEVNDKCKWSKLLEDLNNVFLLSIASEILRLHLKKIKQVY